MLPAHRNAGQHFEAPGLQRAGQSARRSRGRRRQCQRFKCPCECVAIGRQMPDFGEADGLRDSGGDGGPVRFARGPYVGGPSFQRLDLGATEVGAGARRPIEDGTCVPVHLVDGPRYRRWLSELFDALLIRAFQPCH